MLVCFFFFKQKTAYEMRISDWSSDVCSSDLIISDAGLMGYANTSVYCASKGGVALLTKSLGLELAPRGVRVNGVRPSDVDTPMIEFQAQGYGRGDPEGYKRTLLGLHPRGTRARSATRAACADVPLILGPCA